MCVCRSGWSGSLDQGPRLGVKWYLLLILYYYTIKYFNLYIDQQQEQEHKY